MAHPALTIYYRHHSDAVVIIKAGKSATQRTLRNIRRVECAWYALCPGHTLSLLPSLQCCVLLWGHRGCKTPNCDCLSWAHSLCFTEALHVLVKAHCAVSTKTYSFI